MIAPVKLQRAQLGNTCPAQCWTMRIPLPDSDYVNLTHEHESSVQPMIAITLAEILQRSLGSRIPQFHTGIALPQNGSAFKTNGDVPKSTAASAG